MKNIFVRKNLIDIVIKKQQHPNKAMEGWKVLITSRRDVIWTN